MSDIGVKRNPSA